jgi:hypothetical protein
MIAMICRTLLCLMLASPAAAFEITIQNGGGQDLTGISVFEVQGNTVIDDNLGSYGNPIKPGASASFDLAINRCMSVIFYYGFDNGAEAEATADLCQGTSFLLSE